MINEDDTATQLVSNSLQRGKRYTESAHPLTQEHKESTGSNNSDKNAYLAVRLQ